MMGPSLLRWTLSLALTLSFVAATPVDSAVDSAQSPFALKNLEGFPYKSWTEDGREFVQTEYATFARTGHTSLPQKYQLRVQNKPPSLCDPTVKQHSGFLDIGPNKHLFFWFFESRFSPSTAPVILWMNGGPGCSSTTGLLFELGPCRVTENGEGTILHNQSWNEFANMIFLDQPVEVGYSYSSDGTMVDTTPDAAADAWAFLQLFFKMFPEYSKLPFHIAAESYGGHYAPHIASLIHKRNREIALAPIPAVVHINLKSIALGNGLTDPYHQFASIPQYMCEGPYAPFEPNSPTCKKLNSKVPTCQRLVKACYNFKTPLVCTPATLYCNLELQGASLPDDINPYDIRKPCDREKHGDLCYEETQWIDIWMNKPEVKKALGVAPDRPYTGCNLNVTLAFWSKGDTALNSAALLPPLLESGIRVLVYAGQTDAVCNFFGEEIWMENLENHPFRDEFKLAPTLPWITLHEEHPREVGTVRHAGPGAGNFTFVSVYEAGHMMPFDQPEAAFDLIARWVANFPLHWHRLA